jgi:DNA-directed RNA polymerase specialized sigma24 family protein
MDESAPEAELGSDLSIFADEQQYVLRLLRALPPQQRTVAALFYDGLACEEIAELGGRPPATVRSHLRHARGRLKELVTASSP